MEEILSLYIESKKDKRQTGSEMENRLATNDAITMLSDRCQQILEERFIIGKTQMEVAEDLAISQGSSIKT